jgi:putative iron-dependent peroxidase
LSLVHYLRGNIPGLSVFPARAVNGVDIPSTPHALCCWLRGEDRGELLQQSRQIRQQLEPAFRCEQVIDAFRYGPGLDLTGYEDGTENPQDDDAVKAALLQNEQPGLNGSSFLALQQWVHDLDKFQAMPQSAQDHTIGRRKSDNEELDDAPESAHVKRTAQEDFEPEAFLLRRSMPWADEQRQGLVFTAFGHSFAAFEAQLNRMLGLDDGIRDALFDFSRPVTGSYFWCPPVKNGRLNLEAVI